MKKIKTLVVGCGHMGASHARAYRRLENCKIVGLVSRSPESRTELSDELGGLPTFDSFDSALRETKPDLVSINTYPDTHFEYAKKSLESGAHVFIEKPLATTVEEAETLVALALKMKRKMMVGYILRVHPSWNIFVEKTKTLGKPLVMRMNLNQQSAGQKWHTHKQLMKSMSPIVDCGVHYLDMMCLMTQSQPESVSAIGARLTEEIDENMYNYGALQVRFTDGSVGWYEAGWGPMMSETAFFIKDVIGPKGSVSISDNLKGKSQDIEGHTKTGGLLLHHSKLDANGSFLKDDEIFPMENEPDHDELCFLEQELLISAITNDLDLEDHLLDAVNSLKVVLAADQSVKTGKTVYLD